MRDPRDSREKNGGKNARSERVHRYKSYAYGFLTSEFHGASARYLSKCWYFFENACGLSYVRPGKFAERMEK